jgi:hypothetical protein
LDKYRLKANEITEEQYLEVRRQAINSFLAFRMSKLAEELEAVKGNAKEEERVDSEIKILREKISQESLKQEVEKLDTVEKQLERQNKLWLEQKRHIEEATENARKFAEELERLQSAKDIVGADAGEESEGYGPFQSLADSWQNFIDLVNDTGPSIGQTIQAIAGLAVDAFSGFANALGNVVENWVLLGDTGPAVMRKILAQALATLAAEAAVRALWELALGFASLFFNPAEAAAHFTAAAIFGAIAGVAAIAGRAVAGDAFKKQTGAANSKSASSSNPQGERGGVGQYSSYGDKALIKEEGRNSPGLGPIGVDVNIKFQDKPKWFSAMFYEEWKANGKLRRTMRDEIEK